MDGVETALTQLKTYLGLKVIAGIQLDGELGAVPIQHRVSQYKNSLLRLYGAVPLMGSRCGFMTI